VHNYSYYLIGLHIRRGPNKITPFLTDIQIQQTELESKVMPLSKNNHNNNLGNQKNNKNDNFNNTNDTSLKEKKGPPKAGINRAP